MIHSGAKILIESLIKNGVDTIFGYPGGAVLDIYDELFKCKDKIKHVLVTHEQHAAHAADGYARSTGRAGVCLATSGPGATNLVTGIAAAFVDSVPLVAITGNVSLSLLGKDSFQEVDIAGITMPVVKHNWIVENVRDLENIVNEAFYVAQSGRPGPVLIDIPKDVISAECEPSVHRGLTQSKDFRTQNSKLSVRTAELRELRGFSSSSDIEKVVTLIKNSKRPMIFAGGGVVRSGASAEVKKLAELLGAPVALSLMGISAFPSDHPLCTGLIGMHGTAASNKAVQKCDLLIALGARFSERVTGEKNFAKNAKIIHIDIDPAEINKNINADAYIIGDLKKVLDLLLKRLSVDISIKNFNTEYHREIEGFRTQNSELSVRTAELRALRGKNFLHPCFIIQETAKALGENAIVVTDVGQHQIWTARYYPFTGTQKFLTSGGLGAMGFGMGAALGAKIANPKTPVVLFTGDGSFRMNNAEIATLVKYKLPVLIILFNNRALGMLRQWQKLSYKSVYYETDLEAHSPDFIKLAAAYDMPAFSAKDEKSFSIALDAALKLIASGRSVLIVTAIDKNEKV
ncbi:MAG: biosynthetic-type acetolactate synthase large subunit [Treponema sp.]|nr:biosynthetic-type acetolactate synthase large subunit [Treponema sp.]